MVSLIKQKVLVMTHSPRVCSQLRLILASLNAEIQGDKEGSQVFMQRLFPGFKKLCGKAPFPTPATPSNVMDVGKQCTL